MDVYKNISTSQAQTALQSSRSNSSDATTDVRGYELITRTFRSRGDAPTKLPNSRNDITPADPNKRAGQSHRTTESQRQSQI